MNLRRCIRPHQAHAIQCLQSNSLQTAMQAKLDRAKPDVCVVETGAPDTIRTCDLCLRRATLYPAELRVRCGSFSRLPCYRQCPCEAGVGSVRRCVPSLRQRSHVRIVSGAPGHARRACRTVAARFPRTSSRNTVHFGRGEFPVCKSAMLSGKRTCLPEGNTL